MPFYIVLTAFAYLFEIEMVTFHFKDFCMCDVVCQFFLNNVIGVAMHQNEEDEEYC